MVIGSTLTVSEAAMLTMQHVWRDERGGRPERPGSVDRRSCPTNETVDPSPAWSARVTWNDPGRIGDRVGRPARANCSTRVPPELAPRGISPTLTTPGAAKTGPATRVSMRRLGPPWTPGRAWSWARPWLRRPRQQGDRDDHGQREGTHEHGWPRPPGTSARSRGLVDVDRILPGLHAWARIGPPIPSPGSAVGDGISGRLPGRDAAGHPGDPSGNPAARSNEAATLAR